MNETASNEPTQTDSINLGDTVEDTITGLRGIAIARVDWLNGCRRYVVQPKEIKDGKPVEVTTIDVHTLKVVSAAAPAMASPTGGPIPTPERQTKVSY